MKLKMFTTAILAISLFACSKADVLNSEESNLAMSSSSLSSSAAQATYISRWERGFVWTQSDSADFKVYQSNRPTAALTDDIIVKGAVLIFLKNIPYTPDSRIDTARLVPFHVIPYYGNEQGRPQYDQEYYRELSQGNIRLKYRSNRHNFWTGPIPEPDANIEVRVILLSADDLRAIGHNQTSVMRLSYDQIMTAIGGQ